VQFNNLPTDPDTSVWTSCYR